MLSQKTSELAMADSSDWIWSNWLKTQNPMGEKFPYFTQFEFIEDETKRPVIGGNLASLLYKYHTLSPVNTNLLIQLKYPQLASVINSTNDQRPHDNTTRTGNLIEILACEFVKAHGYQVPILRLQYNPNSEQSMKGDDILAFRFSKDAREISSFLIGEGKFRSRFATEAIKEAYNDIVRKTKSYPVSMEFIATILSLDGNVTMAAKIRQLRQKIAFKDSHITPKHLIFLGTIGQPQNPFAYLEEVKADLPPNLIVANVVFKSDFRTWISNIYEREFWQ